jgi:hypothetical protein
MPALLLHLVAVERLTIQGQRLAPELARALAEDVEYARLGAALPLLPMFAGLRGGLASFRPLHQARFATLFHTRTPMSLGFKLAELVANGALVGREPGLAFVAGYLSHLCVDRAFAPLMDSLVQRYRKPKESEAEARARLDFAHAVWLQRDFYGQDLLGEPVLRSKMQVAKRGGLSRGMGRGLYELLRVSAQATFGEAPSKAEVDSWVRGLALYGLMLSSPWGRVRAAQATRSVSRQEVYRGPDADVPACVDRALDDARRLLDRVRRLVARGRFTSRTRGQLVALFSDAALPTCAA